MSPALDLSARPQPDVRAHRPCRVHARQGEEKERGWREGWTGERRDRRGMGGKRGGKKGGERRVTGRRWDSGSVGR
eukprot:1373263-Rhodomonas_salina.2